MEVSSMTQAEFSTLMDVYLVQYLNGGYYTLKYTGEQRVTMQDSLNVRMMALEGCGVQEHTITLPVSG